MSSMLTGLCHATGASELVSRAAARMLSMGSRGTLPRMLNSCWMSLAKVGSLSTDICPMANMLIVGLRG